MSHLQPEMITLCGQSFPLNEPAALMAAYEMTRPLLKSEREAGPAQRPTTLLETLLLAESLMPHDQVTAWMVLPNPALGGHRAIDLVAFGRLDQVVDRLSNPVPRLRLITGQDSSPFE